MPAVLLFALCDICSASAQDARAQITYLNRLAGNAIEAVDVTLDEELLRVLASSLPAKDSDQSKFKDSVSNLKGVYVKGFRFAKAGEYSEADIEELRAQLRSGWERVAYVRNKRGGDNGELYLKLQGDRVAGVVMISAEPTELYVYNLIGTINLERMSFREGLRGLSQLNQDWSRWIDRYRKR